MLSLPRVEMVHLSDEAHERALDRHAGGVGGWLSQQSGQFLMRKAHLDPGDDRFAFFRAQLL